MARITPASRGGDKYRRGEGVMSADPEVIAKVESDKPDLNRLSSEVIMGWHLCGQDWIDRRGFPTSYSLSSWTPLTDLNQCFMVVEKMEVILGTKGFELRKGCVVGLWSAMFPFGGPGGWRVGPEVKSPNEAILESCLILKKETAALKAVGAWEE